MVHNMNRLSVPAELGCTSPPEILTSAGVLRIHISRRHQTQKSCTPCPTSYTRRMHSSSSTHTTKPIIKPGTVYFYPTKGAGLSRPSPDWRRSSPAKPRWHVQADGLLPRGSRNLISSLVLATLPFVEGADTPNGVGKHRSPQYLESQEGPRWSLEVTPSRSCHHLVPGQRTRDARGLGLDRQWHYYY